MNIPLLDNINQYIINPIIAFMIALALVYFMVGVVQFILGMDSEEKRTAGQKHMLYGTFGLFIMISVFGLMNIICNTVGC